MQVFEVAPFQISFARLPSTYLGPHGNSANQKETSIQKDLRHLAECFCHQIVYSMNGYEQECKNDSERQKRWTTPKAVRFGVDGGVINPAKSLAQSEFFPSKIQ